MCAAKKQQITINIAFMQQLCYTAGCGGEIMISVGAYLKRQRERLSLSLNAVCEQTGITSTRLNRIERNLINEPSPDALKKLATLYQIDLIHLFKLAGYLDDQITKEVYPFRNYEILNDDECEFIQQSIDFFAKKHSISSKEEYHEI